MASEHGPGFSTGRCAPALRAIPGVLLRSVPTDKALLKYQKETSERLFLWHQPRCFDDSHTVGQHPRSFIKCPPLYDFRQREY